MSTLIQKVIESPWHVKLKILRVIKDCTLKDVANGVCSDPRVICNWENEKAMPRDIHKKAISEFYEVPQEDIFGGSGASK